MIVAVLNNSITSVAEQNQDVFVAYITIHCDSVGIGQMGEGEEGDGLFSAI